MISCVVFDLGEVLSSPDTLYSEPARVLGVDPVAFEEAYWADRRAYDEGGSDADYWGPVLKAVGKNPTPELIRLLAVEDARRWTVLRPEAHRLLKDVKATGVTVAVLSNAPFALDMALAEQDYADDADFWFVSASMGVTKPNPAAFWRVQDVVEVPPDQIAFLDDRPANVHAARSAGWQAHLFVDDADSRAWLEELGVL